MALIGLLDGQVAGWKYKWVSVQNCTSLNMVAATVNYNTFMLYTIVVEAQLNKIDSLQYLAKSYISGSELWQYCFSKFHSFSLLKKAVLKHDLLYCQTYKSIKIPVHVHVYGKYKRDSLCTILIIHGLSYVHL